MIKEILETIYNNEIYKDSSKKHKKTDVQKLHKVLENLILDLNDAYYNKSQSLIEDREYDDLLKTYEDLCEKYKLKNKISVGATSPHAKISHNTPMLSLSNSYNKQDILQFMKRHPAIEYSCELKLDGVSFNLIYEDGVLAKAITRGDGKIGESIMHNLPDTIPTRIDIKDDIEVRGEFFLYRDQFARINEERAKMKLPLFANPRNTVSGIIRSIEKSPIQAQYIIYGTPNELRPTQEETLQYLKQLKFNINDRGVVCRNIDEIERYYNQILSERDGLNYAS